MDSDGEELPRAKRPKVNGKIKKELNLRAEDGYINGYIGAESPYREGSIVRVTMKNFVTYDAAEIRPGPRLNVIIGANGTGKSTLVCAIVLGLGGKPAVLGRAKEPRDFIKHGEDTATIEIELSAGPENRRANYVVRRKIFSDSTSMWKFDGKKSTQSEVLNLVHSLNIQVENLCQFLPQDRVSSFAAMDPVELLHETEMAIDEKLESQHKELIKLKLSETESQHTFEANNRTLQDLRAQNEALQREVNRFMERQRLVEQLNCLESKRPWVAFEAKRLQYVEISNSLKVLEAELKEAESRNEPLEKVLNEARAALEGSENEEKDAQKQIATIQTKRNQLSEQLKESMAKIKANEQKIEEFDEREARRMQEVVKIRKTIEALQVQLEQEKSRDNEREEELRAAKLDEEKAKILERSAMSEVNELSSKLYPIDQSLNQLYASKQTIEMERKKRIQIIAKESRATYDIMEALRTGAIKTSMKVFGPLQLEIVVSNNQEAIWMDKQLSWADANVFVCQTSEDRDSMYSYCQKHKIPHPTIWYTPNAHQKTFKHPMSKTDLAKFGFKGFLDEIIDCDPIVKISLLEVNKLHLIPFGGDEVENHLDEIQHLAISHDIRRFYSATTSYSTVTSNYSNVITINTVTLILNDPHHKVMISQMSELETIERAILIKREEHQSLKQKQEEAKRVLDSAKKQVANLKTRISELGHSKVKQITLQLNTKSGELESVSVSGEVEKERLLTALKTLSKAGIAPSIKLHQCSRLLLEATIVAAKCALKKGALVGAVTSAALVLQNAKENFREIINKRDHAKLQANAAKDEARKLKTAAEKAFPKTAELEAKWAASNIPNDLNEIDILIDNIKIRVSALSHDQSILEKYEARKAEIEKLEVVVTNFQNEINDKKAKMAELKEEWLPVIKGKVQEISGNFSKFFSDIGCTGEVRLFIEEDNFAKYGIEIFVSYRSHEAVRRLDARVQSGGERSVATMLYLIALQKLSECPFRLVDEINQGMDPSNERMIFKQVTAQASQDGTPQYFMITPKLLTGLPFTPAITVLCVCNGPFMAKQEEWTVTT